VRYNPTTKSTTGEAEELKVATEADLNRSMAGDDMNWYELRVDGKQPERRAHHTSFMIGNKMYIYGGYDIREGPMSSLWSFDTNNVGNLANLDFDQ